MDTSARRRSVSVRVCVALAGLCHLSWLSETVSPSLLPSRTSYVSELMALDQPWSTAMRVTDTVAGLLVLAAALLTWGLTRSWRPAARPWDRRLTRAALLGLAVFGVATIVDAASPMACAPSISAACAAAEAAGTVPLHHGLHSLSSSIATLGAVVGFASLAVVLSTSPSARHRGLRVAVAVAVAAYVVTTAWVLVEVAGATHGSPLLDRVGWGLVGWSQRAQVTLSSVCLLLVAALPSPVPHARPQVCP